MAREEGGRSVDEDELELASGVLFRLLAKWLADILNVDYRDETDEGREGSWPRNEG